MAYVYPRKSRSVRDLLRRRQYFVHHQSELLGHIQNTNTQYNLPPFEKKITNQSNRTQLDGRFAQYRFVQSLDMLKRRELFAPKKFFKYSVHAPAT
jgi:hypothetical protein